MVGAITTIQPGRLPAIPLPQAGNQPDAAVLPRIPLPTDSYQPSQQIAPDSTESRLDRKVFAPLLRSLTSSPLTNRLMLAISKWREPVPKDATIPNFGIVSPQVWRGGLPSRQGFEVLAQQGVRTVVNLAAEHPEEADFLSQLGLRPVAILMNPFGPPTMVQAFQFLSVVIDPANAPVYVHCYHGKDRTGAMIAVYRIAHDGWTAEQAIAEMRRYGLHEDYHEDKVEFVRRFEKVWHNLAARQFYMRKADLISSAA